MIICCSCSIRYRHGGDLYPYHSICRHGPCRSHRLRSHHNHLHRIHRTGDVEDSFLRR